MAKKPAQKRSQGAKSAKKVNVNFRLPPDLVTLLDAFAVLSAKEHGCRASRSMAARLLLQRAIVAHGQGNLAKPAANDVNARDLVKVG